MQIPFVFFVCIQNLLLVAFVVSVSGAQKKPEVINSIIIVAVFCSNVFFLKFFVARICVSCVGFLHPEP